MSETGSGSGTPNLVPKPISNFTPPSVKVGPRAICVPLDFSAEASYSITLAGLINARYIDGVQSVFADNSGNAAPLVITTQQGQNLIVPAGCQAYLPLITTVPPDIQFASSGGVLVTVQLLNVPMPAAVWSVVASSGGTVDVVGTVAISGGTVDVGGIVDVAGTVAVNGGTVAIAGTVPVAGTVSVAGTVPVSGTVSILAADTVAVAGTVAVSGVVTPVDGLIFSGSISALGVITYSAPGPANGIIDTAGYAAVSFQPVGSWNASILAEGSNDGATWSTCPVITNNNPPTLGNTLGASPSNIISKSFRYLRARVTTYVSGTVAFNVCMMMVNTPNYPASQGQNSNGYWNVALAAIPTQSGILLGRIQSAASTNLTLVKNTHGNLYAVDIGNGGTVDAWIKFYNKATAPVIGTDTPVFTSYIPKGTARTISYSTPYGFTVGLGYGITGAAADTDTTAVALNQITGVINYA
jgi:hypothetical protein